MGFTNSCWCTLNLTLNTWGKSAHGFAIEKTQVWAKDVIGCMDVALSDVQVLDYIVVKYLFKLLIAGVHHDVLHLSCPHCVSVCLLIVARHFLFHCCHHIPFIFFSVRMRQCIEPLCSWAECKYFVSKIDGEGIADLSVKLYLLVFLDNM